MKILSLLIIFMISYSSMAAIKQVTPDMVIKHIHRHGANKYLHDLYEESSRATSVSEWESIVEGISSGEAQWLQIVPLIARYTDAGFAEDLATALAQAIPENVSGVMVVLDEKIPPVSIRNVCSMPLYNETVAEKNEYVVKAIQALYKNDKPQAKNCLTQLINTVGKAGQFRMVD